MSVGGVPRTGRAAAGFGELQERDTERELALAALDELVLGRGAVIAFEGPAGAGKTALLHAVCLQARERDATVLAARGVELEQTLASGMVGQLFLPLVMGEGALLDGSAALAAPALGLPGTVEVVDPGASALHGLYWLCVNIAERGPLVLAVDDAHWADEASVRFLAHLAPRIADLPILLLIAARTAEPGADRAVLDALLRDAAVRVRRPEPLSAAAAATIVRDRLGGASDGICRACHEQSGGNPFLLHELVEALRDADLEEADVARLEPASVADSVGARLARLPDAATAVARAVALFPGGAELRHVLALAGVDEATATMSVEQLTATAILAPGRPLTFLHPLIRTAVYTGIPEVRSSSLHLTAARLLRQESAPPAAIAVHLLPTEPGMDPAAFGELAAAAFTAMQAGAPNSAIRFLDRALAEPVTDAEAAGALLLRGGARALSADPRAEADLRAAAEKAPSGPVRAAALHQLARFLGFAINTETADAAFAAAIEEFERAQPDMVDACRVDRLLVMFTHDAHAPRFVDEMADLPAPEHPTTLAHHGFCTLKAHWMAWNYDDAAATIGWARRGLAFAADRFTVDQLALYPLAGVALTAADEPALFLEAAAPVVAAARRAGDRRCTATLHLMTGSARLYAGDLIEAEADMAIATEAWAAEPSTPLAAGVRTVGAIIALERRGAAAAEAVIGDLTLAPSVLAMALQAARGRIELASARPEQALADLEAAAAAARLRGLRNHLYMFAWGGYLALAAHAAGDRERALAIADEHLQGARRFGAAGVLGDLLRIAGLIREGEEQIALLTEAAKVLRASNARLVEAKALADLGAALRRADRREAAREPLKAAIDLAHRCGATVLADHAAEELRAAGGRVRRTYVTGVEALTPAERRVAAMAASGLSNRQIAQQLFVTLRTVEMHMTSAYAKLGVKSRDDLAGVL